MLYTQSDKETKSEGNAIRTISVRLTGDQFRKLNELMDKLGVGAFQNGDIRSEKLRKFIDNLYDYYVLRNPVTVTTPKTLMEISRVVCPHCLKCNRWIAIDVDDRLYLICDLCGTPFDTKLAPKSREQLKEASERAKIEEVSPCHS